MPTLLKEEVGALLPGAPATKGTEKDCSPVGLGPKPAERWPPAACFSPWPQTGGWPPCSACLLCAGAQFLFMLRTLRQGLFLVTDTEETEGLRGCDLIRVTQTLVQVSVACGCWSSSRSNKHR